jgi:cysteine-rich repeat protein
MRALILAAAGLMGCSQILGIDDVTQVDAGGAPPNTVIGRVYTRFRTPAGVTDVPSDASNMIIRAMIPDAGQPTGFVVVDGVGRPDGTLSISPVPDGVEYYLRLDRDYYVTTRHEIDFHVEYPVRSDPAVASSTTTVDFAITDMSPFIASPNGGPKDDLIEIDSFSLMYQGYSAATDRSLVWSQPFDWTSGSSLVSLQSPLPDAARGDDLWILHLRKTVDLTTERKHEVSQLVDTANPPTQTITNGGTASFSAEFRPVVINKTLGLSFTRGLFDNGFDSTTQFLNAYVNLHANPVPTDYGFGASLVDVTFNDWSRSTAGTESLTVMYGDPYPTSWTRHLEVGYARVRWFQLPGTTTPRYIAGYIGKTLPYTSGFPQLSPSVVPPANVKIAGKLAAAGGVVAHDGVTPTTLAWNAVAGAETYVVVMYRVYVNGSATRTQPAASFTTTATSMLIPADALTGGEFFAFSVAAVQSPADYNAGELIPNGVPTHFAATPTGMFRFSASCGNGTVDAGEQCDTMGESASCDVDCTPVLCGDGLRNAAAGEACDSLRDTDGCDSDCTVPTCGDGHVNTATEDCDDGDTTDSNNGCSTACKLNNVCGDGQHASAAEECDTGGDSATCDADCTAPECTDGHLNTTANEQCDDGNFDDTDHCTSSCVIN